MFVGVFVGVFVGYILLIVLALHKAPIECYYLVNHNDGYGEKLHLYYIGQ